MTIAATMPRVALFAVASHHTTTRWSIVATRAASGVWTVSRVGEESGGLLRWRRCPYPVTQATLAAAAGRRLDALLADRRLYGEQVAGGSLSIGGFAVTIEIATARRHRTITWTARLTGRLGQVADIIAP